MTVRIYEVLPDTLYVSARTAAMTRQEKLAAVKDYKITAVVNLWHTPDEEMKSLCKAYAHYPMSDGRNRNDQQVTAAVDRVLYLLDHEHRVLVHCYGGRNRAGLICSLVMRQGLGISGKHAAELFIKARPNSLVNRHFKSYLEGLPKP